MFDLTFKRSRRVLNVKVDYLLNSNQDLSRPRLRFCLDVNMSSTTKI